jgi:hypothetical protein
MVILMAGSTLTSKGQVTLPKRAAGAERVVTFDGGSCARPTSWKSELCYSPRHHSS